MEPIKHDCGNCFRKYEGTNLQQSVYFSESPCGPIKARPIRAHKGPIRAWPMRARPIRPDPEGPGPNSPGDGGGSLYLSCYFDAVKIEGIAQAWLLLDFWHSCSIAPCILLGQNRVYEFINYGLTNSFVC